MFGMGLTLTPPDFAVIAKRPVPVVIGVVAQYAVMPFLGWLIAAALGLPPALAAGVILVGCCPGGTASNVVSYLAKGDVALSVAMSTVSTLIAPLLTPVLALWLAGQYMPVDAGSMAWSIVQIVLLPVLLGLVIRRFLPGLVTRALPPYPGFRSWPSPSWWLPWLPEAQRPSSLPDCWYSRPSFSTTDWATPSVTLRPACSGCQFLPGGSPPSRSACRIQALRRDWHGST
ncbi:uncharacterized sodium-dependent transporter YocS [Arthrobacter sp. Hiyo4]|nr:uncharacterized sodium-dependent transporter YocS [Arthrobacter sp. Hiyo4]